MDSNSIGFQSYKKVLFFILSTSIATELSSHDSNWMETCKMHINYLLSKLSIICFIMRKLVHVLNIETLKGVHFTHFHSLIKYWILFWCSSTTHTHTHKKILRTMLGIYPSASVKVGLWNYIFCQCEACIFFSLIMFLINNVDNFKTNLSLHNFNTRSKNQLHFLSVKLTSVKKWCHLFCYKNI